MKKYMIGHPEYECWDFMSTLTDENTTHVIRNRSQPRGTLSRMIPEYESRKGDVTLVWKKT
jgi:hypothetical protein